MYRLGRFAVFGLTVGMLLAIAPIAGCPPGRDDNGTDTTDDDGTGLPDANDPGNGDVPDSTDPNEPGNDVQETRYQLTITVEGSGSVDPGSGEHNAGSVVTLTATADSGWRFDRWEGDLTGNENPVAVTLADHLAITAVFVAEAAAAFDFYAVYDWIVDTEQLPEGDAVGPAVMSANGQKVAFSNGRGVSSRKAYMLNADGSGLNAYNLPDGEGVADHVAIDEDGSRAYFASWYDEKIFKIEGGAVATISWTVPPGPDWVEDLQTTADGASIYFRDYSGDIWRVGQDGGGLTKIIDDAAVPCVDGTPGGIYDMAVSAAGDTIAFTMIVKRQVEGGERLDLEVFAWNGSSATELTVDRQGLYCKGRVAISGDGGTVVYQDFEDDQFYAMDVNGADSRALEYPGFNFGGMALTFDGAQMFYSDANAEGGRLVETDASGVLDLFPGWNVTTIVIAATYDTGISRDGSRVFFRFEYASFPFKHALYVGYLNDPNAVSGAPQIEAINFSPASMPRGAADARVVMTVTASDPDGLSDIGHVVTDEFLDGKLGGVNADLPAYFYFDPHDDGAAPDATTGDGIYSTSGQPGGKVDTLDALTMRVGVQDESKTVVVADTVLVIGP